MKKFLFIIPILIFCFSFSVGAFETHDLNEIYSEQLKAVGGDELSENLPEESKKTLDNIK